MTRRRDERIKFSFVVMGPKETAVPASIQLPTLAGRIVSDALSSKGKVERWLCDQDGRLTRLRLLDKDRTEANELFADGDRGTLVRIEGAAELPRLSKETVVRRAVSGSIAARQPLNEGPTPP